MKSPRAGDARQDDYDLWPGTDFLDTWIPWSCHGSARVLYLDGHTQSVNRTDGYLGMYPGGQVVRDVRFYP